MIGGLEFQHFLLELKAIKGNSVGGFAEQHQVENLRHFSVWSLEFSPRTLFPYTLTGRRGKFLTHEPVKR